MSWHEDDQDAADQLQREEDERQAREQEEEERILQEEEDGRAAREDQERLDQEEQGKRAQAEEERLQVEQIEAAETHERETLAREDEAREQEARELADQDREEDQNRELEEDERARQDSVRGALHAERDFWSGAGSGSRETPHWSHMAAFSGAQANHGRLVSALGRRAGLLYRLQYVAATGTWVLLADQPGDDLARALLGAGVLLQPNPFRQDG